MTLPPTMAGAPASLAAAAIVAVWVAVAGCSGVLHRPDAARRPGLPLPARYAGGGDATEAAIAPRWWTSLGDAQLDALCRRAMQGNFDLRRARARLVAAAAASDAAAAGIWPALQLDTSINRARQNVFLGRAVAFETTNFPVSLTASYELDLWGRVAHGRTAAALDAVAVAEDAQAAAITITAQVADAYLAVLGERATLALLAEQERVNAQLLELVELRFSRGIVGAVDVLQQRAQLEAIAGQRPAVTARLTTAQQRLAVLLGGAPGDAIAIDGDALPRLDALPIIGLPAQLLEARPDVRAAQRRMLAVDHRVASAKADRLPALRLTAQTGFQGRDRPTLVFLDNWVWQLLAGLTAPLLDGGRRRAEVDRTIAVLAEAVAAYAQVVQRALAEVEEALTREQGERDGLAMLERRLTLAERIVAETRFRYAHGQSDYLPVVSAVAAQQALQQDRLLRRRALWSARIGLLRALGGAPLSGDAAGAVTEPKADTPTPAGGAGRRQG